MDEMWRFEPKRRSQKSRDPMQASFFTNASIDDDTHALVREAIQNSLDAKVDRFSSEPVYVRFSIGLHAAGNGVMNRYIPDSAWLHFNADDNGLRFPPSADDDCRFLVYEDFNTHGLIGDEKAFEAEKGNSFYFFMRAEGQSGKQDGELGRHGIGKYVFPYTSNIRMFLAATVRSSDGRCLMAGQAVLKSHKVGRDRFTPDGWWGAFEQDSEEDYFPLPVEDKNLFHRMASDFCLSRNLGQSGLSLIMPYIRDEVTASKISEHVVQEYFWPILEGRLVVDVEENGSTQKIDRDTVVKSLAGLMEPGKAEQISPFISIANKVLLEKNFPIVKLSLPQYPSVPKWDSDYLLKEHAVEIHRGLSSPGSIVCVRCPIYVQEEGSGEARESFFDIYVSKDVSDSSRRPRFLREGIIVPEDRVKAVRGYICMVVIPSGYLATLLGDSENPAHTEWEKNATKFKGKYKWGAKTIDFVRGAAVKMLGLLSQGDEDEDASILSDIFYLDFPENDDDVPESRRRRRNPEAGPETPPKPDSIPPARPRSYRLARSSGGFVVSGPSQPLEHRRKYKVRVAYDFSGASKSKALNAWEKSDFDLSTGSNVSLPEAENLVGISVDGNSVEFIAENNEFRLSVNGFDSRRDIIVDVESEVLTDEEV